MPVLPIVRLGHPSLRMKSKPVSRAELEHPKVQAFIDDLIATCIAANGAGIAAPQVAVNRQIIIVNVDSKNGRYPGRDPFPLTVAVNPVVKKPSSEMAEDWEGDLSADVRALVPRPKTCEVHFWDRHGNDVQLKLSGFPARVFQHEIDHLHGIFLTDKVKRVESLCEIEMYETYWLGHDRLPQHPEFFKLPGLEG